MAGYIIICICVGIVLLIVLLLYFSKKNEEEAAKAEFQDYLNELHEIDTKYYPHMRQLGKNLNIVNYWLKTGHDPAQSEEDSENAKKEDLFYAGRMDKLEARKWANAVKKSMEAEAEDAAKKKSRVPEFTVENMNGLDWEQYEMKFIYSKDFGESICYCGTPEALEKQHYKYVVFFTTARPANLPLVYPYKYEGAQLVSLYKHPSQAYWFLDNWKLIRDGLEGTSAKATMVGESLAEFNL